MGTLVIDLLEVDPLPVGDEELTVDLQPERLRGGVLIRIEATGVEIDEAGTVPAAADKAPLTQGFFIRDQAGAVGDDRFGVGGAVGLCPSFWHRRVGVHTDLLFSVR